MEELKSFNEWFDTDEMHYQFDLDRSRKKDANIITDPNPTIKVKHLIKFLNKLNPDAVVSLREKGWNPTKRYFNDEIDVIERSGVFTHDLEKVTINN